MIQTINKVPYDTLDITKVVTIKAEILSSKLNVQNVTYEIEFVAWWEEPYTEVVDSIEQTFVKRNIVRKSKETFDIETVDYLRNVVLQMYPTTSEGTLKEIHILNYAHLMLNNQKQDRNTQWEIVV
jgi:hypothetical protein